jgi:hypothetical protein
MGSLRLFCGDELQELFGSDQGVMDWNPEQLLHVFKFEHGYVPACRTRVLRCNSRAQPACVYARARCLGDAQLSSCMRLAVTGWLSMLQLQEQQQRGKTAGAGVSRAPGRIQA